MARFRRRTCIILLLFILFICSIMMALKTLRPERAGFGDPFGLGLFPDFQQQTAHLKNKFNLQNRAKEDSFTQSKKLQMLTMNIKTSMASVGKLEDLPAPNYNFHVFYYSWFGSPQFDGKYIHWNHPLLTHWDAKIASGYPKGRHNPPDDIGASFYPELGPYSSKDPSVIEAHVKQMSSASIGVLALSWYPPGMADENGEPTDGLVPTILDIAHKYKLKVAFHIEPYKDRDDHTMYSNVKYIIDKYGDHPAFYRHKVSTGPGYVDTSIRPWNNHNTRNRVNGKYYETAFSAALLVRPEIISITSFNEWHEGTQIEKAIPKKFGKTTYLDYQPHKPNIYLELTRKWSEKYSKEKEKWLT